MAIRIGLLFALLVAAGCMSACSRGTDADEGTFSLTLSYDEREISKDSNEQLTEIAIEGRRVIVRVGRSGSLVRIVIVSS